jgi:hypothetical protein
MRIVFALAASVLVSGFLLGISGCGKSGATAGRDPTAGEPHHHAHEAAGPHNGHIIELGSPTHHAELTHDDTSHKIGIYLLDGSAKELAPIEAESVTINVAVDGKSTPYVLPAVRQPNDAEGQASHFELESESLCAIVCGESESPDTTARVSITIDGQPYVGIIETQPHDHDHDHDHGHDHGHDH